MCSSDLGEAVSLVCVDEEGFLKEIERLIKRSIPRETVAAFEPPPGEKAEPIVLGRRMTLGVAPASRQRRMQTSGHGRPASKPSSSRRPVRSR